MAPKTPQANSKLPKPPLTGGPAPFTGIPAPASVLQRRSFMPSSSGGSVSRALKDMTPEQQALLAEAISMHSPGLIDPFKKPTNTTPSATNRAAGSGGPGAGMHPEPGLGMGMSTALGFSAPHNHHQPTSPVGNADRASPTGLPSLGSYRAPTSQSSQIGRRPSSSRLGMHADVSAASLNHSNLPGLHSTITNSSQQFSRPASYSGMSPLSISNPNLPSASSSSPSPTTPVSQSRAPSGSPSGSRPALTASRLSAAQGAVNGNGGNAPARASQMKQPLFQRPQGTAIASAVKNPLAVMPGTQAITPPSLDNFEIGDRVIVESMDISGYLRFLGPAEFKSGTWAGIELDTPTGKNDGSVGGVVYFHCRPKYGIFVLAAKVAKSELLFPSSPELTADHPSSVLEEVSPVINHAAQAASKITAGSRASKYIGMTATQLKQRDVPQPAATSRPSTEASFNLPGTSYRAASPTVKTLGGMAVSPTSSRTITPVSANGSTKSPSPIPKPLFRSSSPTTRSGSGARTPYIAGKPTLATLNQKSVAHSRSTSSASSVTSQSSANGSRARTSPSPRTSTTPKRLSSRSETPEVVSHLSPGESRSSPLDHATAIQAVSPADNVSLQLQQLQIDFETALAENNLLKSEMHEAKSRLESTKLLEKKDLSYEERSFLSKTLNRSEIDERLAQELDDLHAMKAIWDKEKAAKEQDIKVVTEKMTQAWLDAARSQKEKAAAIHERDDLFGKLMKLEGNDGVDINSEDAMTNQQHQQQDTIDSLRKTLQEAEEKTRALESTLQEMTVRSTEEEERLNKADIDNETKVTELEADRNDLEAKLRELEVTSEEKMSEMQLKLKAAQEEASATRLALSETEGKLDEEVEAHRARKSESEARMAALEGDLQELQALLAKSDKTCSGLEEKVKEHEASIVKRDQDIASLKLEIEDIGGMVQSEEVNRMRKVWELEKKRLEESVTDNITVMVALRDEIQTLESSEEQLQATIKTLESSLTNFKELKTAAESEVAQLAASLKETEEAFIQERSALQIQIAASESTLESRLSETKARLEELEVIALSVEEWRERCEAMQFEMIQKTAAVEELSLKLADVQDKALEDHTAALESSRAEIASFEEDRERLLTKISELEAALALSASVPRASVPGAVDAEVVLDRAELEGEIAALKQMVHELTTENVSVAGDNKKLMEQHDLLMEAHKHVEAECLKLMDEVERLHSESLAVTSIGDSEGADRGDLEVIHIKAGSKASLIGQEELKVALSNAAVLSKDGTVLASLEKPAGQNQTASTIRLENLLKDKQAMLDRLTQAHALEIRDLRQRYVELDRSKAWEISQLNKELTELESLIESKIFHEADLEEEVQEKQKQIDRLKQEIAELKTQLSKIMSGSHGSIADLPPNGLSFSPSDRRLTSDKLFSGMNGVSNLLVSDRARTVTNGTDKTMFCEICEVEGHDIVTCAAVFGGGKTDGVSSVSVPSTLTPLFSEKELEDTRPYCENCEEYGVHYTDECPDESVTY
ncbi:CAP-Gly domain-containing linker protein 4 [Dissophora globulifera]|uniref:CAP-Gly domain-containing linker protein 4 n=1 Tax=Dissophora globulifera TaxID=979702 RepID=A0A9P6V0K3_9FUNG|nr:CAP-Gly domain-containing linker protein 4 [Dissophora globulifera]